MVQIRAFIAIEISKEAKDEIAGIIGILKENSGGVKWVDPENLHITLKFLGSVQEERIPEISEMIRKTALSISRFSISLGKLGAFPSWKHPKVIYIDLNSGADVLTHIAGKVEDAMFEIGFDKENRTFLPHITLGRVKKGRNKRISLRSAEKTEVENVRSPVNSIFLKRSVLLPTGSVYSILSENGFKAV